MKSIFFKAEYGTAFSTAIDYWTTEHGFNPIDHLRYIKNPKGYSHSEVMFSKAATLWYINNASLDGGNKSPYRTLLDISDSQIHPRIALADQIMGDNLRLCFSASEQDKCVRHKLIDIEPDKWDAIEMEADLELEKKTILRCQDELCGLGYAYFELGGFLTPLDIILPSKKRLWCSQSTGIVLSWDWMPKLAKPIAPNPLYKHLAAMPEPLRVM